MNIAFVRNRNYQRHLKVIVDCNQHLAKVQKKVLIAVSCHFYV